VWLMERLQPHLPCSTFPKSVHVPDIYANHFANIKLLDESSEVCLVIGICLPQYVNDSSLVRCYAAIDRHLIATPDDQETLLPCPAEDRVEAKEEDTQFFRCLSSSFLLLPPHTLLGVLFLRSCVLGVHKGISTVNTTLKALQFPAIRA
jgi:hypothetical protein